MKRHRLGIVLTMVAALMSLAVVFVGCDWFDDDEQQGKSSKYVFVANTNADSISVFKINSDGTLTSVDNVALAPGSKPTNIALTPNGKFLYIVNSNNAGEGETGDNTSIGAYTYNNSTGAFTEIEGSPFSSPLDEFGYNYGVYINVAITPNGKFLYVTDQWNATVDIFKIESNGVLTFQESVEVYDPHGIAMHPKGKFLFVGSESDEVFSFAIADNGALTQVGDPAAVDGAYVWLAVAPNGKYLYGAGNYYGAVLSIADNGALTVAYNDVLEDTIKSLAITPNGKYLYTGNWGSGTVFAGKITSDGGVDNVSVDPFAAGTKPKSVAVTRNSRYLYVANYGSSDVTGFEILSDGTLDYCDTYPLPAGAGPKFITTLP